MHDIIKLSLTNLIDQHRKLPEYQILLAAWFNRAESASTKMAYLLEVSPQFKFLEMTHSQADSFGLGHIKLLRHWMVSPTVLEEILDPDNAKYSELRSLLRDAEILHLDSSGLGPRAIERFGKDFMLPDNAIEVWYLDPQQYAQFQSQKSHPVLNARPHAAVLVIEESQDFVHRKGIMFAPDLITNGWTPNTPQGVTPYTWYSEATKGSPGYFIFRGGRPHQILGFEIVARPSLAKILPRPNPDNLYVQVLLKAA